MKKLLRIVFVLLVAKPIIVSAMRQCAWVAKPRSLARSARSRTMSVISALVSWASP